MAIYKVKPNQNIWDVALHVCGSVEGIFDLLVSNDGLSLTIDLTPGMELEYHEDFVINQGIVSQINNEKYLPANGERHVYYKNTDKPLVFIFDVPEYMDFILFDVSGNGEMLIDWGDNTDIEEVVLTSSVYSCIHHFDNTVDERRLKIYGDFSLMTFNTSKIGGAVLPVIPVVVDEFTSRANSNSLTGLALFEGTVKLDLQNMYISDLSSIYDMSLQELNLLRVKFQDVKVLDDYLQNIVSNYGNRRNCTVYLDTEPSEQGMAAIQTIINEESWNEAGVWKFIINDQIYTKE
jgi:hypothetical protein